MHSNRNYEWSNTETKKAFDSLINRLSTVAHGISELEGRPMEKSQTEMQREKLWGKQNKIKPQIIPEK